MVRLLLFLSLFLLNAHADEFNRGQYPIDDPEVGQALIVVADVGATRDVLNYFYKCYDKRTKPTSVKPPENWQQVPKLTDVPVCLFRPRADLYNSVNKLFNVRYSRLKIQPGRLNDCSIHENAIVDLRRLCHAWQPPN